MSRSSIEKGSSEKTKMDQEKPREEKQSKFWNLPRDIMFNILSRLPLRSVIRFSCVSKSWLDMIKDPDFGNLHFNQSAADPMLLILSHRIMTESILSISSMKIQGPAIHVSEIPIGHMVSSQTWNLVGTCNGLLCFTSGEHQELVMVCNPITREHVALPKPTAATPGSCVPMFGFGFDPLMKKYKVVRVFYPERSGINNNVFNATAEVYTLGAAGSWRAVGDAQYPPFGKSAYANGAVHWRINPFRRLVRTNRVLNQRNRQMHLFLPHGSLAQSDSIVSFDFGTEEFSLTAHPVFGWDSSLAELGGCLSVVDLTSRTFAEVWVQKDHIANHWEQEYVIPVHEPRGLDKAFPRLMCIQEHNGVLLIWLQDSLVSYERRLIRRRDLKIVGLPTWLDWEICSGFRGSLVPLGVYGGNRDDCKDVARFICDTELYSGQMSSAVVSEPKGKCDGIVTCFAKNGMLVT